MAEIWHCALGQPCQLASPRRCARPCWRTSATACTSSIARRRILYWNKGAERITGYSKDEVLGRRCQDNLLNHCDDAGHDPVHPPSARCRRRCATASTERRTSTSGTRTGIASPCASGRQRSGTPMVPSSAQWRHSTTTASCSTPASANSSSSANRCSIRSPASEIGASVRRRWRVGSRSTRPIGRTFGVLFADIDRFKQVNDRFGHDIGDEALRAVARTLAETSRTSDTIVRWGGEEFVVLVGDARPRRSS